MGINIEYLRQLTALSGVSGFEQEVQKTFSRYLSPYATTVSRDILGSRLARLSWPSEQGSSHSGDTTRILFAAHADEVGALVRYIAPNGLLYLTSVGRWDPELWVAQSVQVHTPQGVVPGVVGRKPYHLLGEGDLSHRTALSDIWVDIGAGSGEEAKSLVGVGCQVTPTAVWQPLANGLLSGKSFDNRAGLFIISEAFRQLAPIVSSAQGAFSLAALSASQEEIGYRGAKVAGESWRPDLALVVDTVHVSDTPGVDPRALGEVKLGLGPVIVVGPNFTSALTSRLLRVAQTQGLPYQVAASGMVTGTDANALQTCGRGVATSLIGLPIRYMHSPREVVSCLDIEHAIELLVALVSSLLAEPLDCLGEEE